MPKVLGFSDSRGDFASSSWTAILKKMGGDLDRKLRVPAVCCLSLGYHDVMKLLPCQNAFFLLIRLIISAKMSGAASERYSKHGMLLPVFSLQHSKRKVWNFDLFYYLCKLVLLLRAHHQMPRLAQTPSQCIHRNVICMSEAPLGSCCLLSVAVRPPAATPSTGNLPRTM